MRKSRQNKNLNEHGPARAREGVRRNRSHSPAFVRASSCFLALALATVATGSIQSPTVPQSSYRSGLVRNPNPIDTSSNLPITGNVAGGKQFQGNIPYGSTSSFGAPLGSTSLDSFLRSSTVPQTRAGYSQSYTPFYSGTGTVTTTVPGYQGVFSPTSPRIVGTLDPSATGPIDSMASVGGSIPQFSTDGVNVAVGSAVGGLSPLRYGSTPGSLGVAANEPGNRLGETPLSPTGDPLMTIEEYRHRLEQLRQGVEKLQDTATQTERNLDAETQTTPLQTTGPQSLQEPLQPLTLVMPGQQQDAGLQPTETSTENPQATTPSNARLGLYDPSAAVAPQTGLVSTPGATGPMGGSLSNPTGGQTTEPVKLPALQRIEETTRAYDAASRIPNRSLSDKPDATSIADRLRDASRRRTEAQEGIESDPAQARSESLQGSPAGEPQTPQDSGSLTQDQFNRYLTAGRLSLQQGRYNRAADAFTLASVYIPNDARAHIGKSHALLAAGEYTGSAASLAGAIQLDAKCALRKVDLVDVLGGPDLFVERISNLEERAQGDDNASQLQFLLAYVYFEMGRVEEARNAIHTVKQAVPSTPAVNALAAAIDGATTN